MLNKFFTGTGGIIGWSIGGIIGYSIGRYYPSILLQFVVAFILYWFGKKIIKRSFTTSPARNEPRKKLIYILSGLGLLGFISPILGFMLALPAFLIATELLTMEYSERKKLIIISGIVVAICLLNAAYGAILYQEGALMAPDI